MNKMRKTITALLVFALTAWSAAAQHQLSGVVTDTDGTPLPAATVMVKGS